jgi:hypothetical protein
MKQDIDLFFKIPNKTYILISVSLVLLISIFCLILFFPISICINAIYVNAYTLSTNFSYKEFLEKDKMVKIDSYEANNIIKGFSIQDKQNLYIFLKNSISNKKDYKIEIEKKTLFEMFFDKNKE